MNPAPGVPSFRVMALYGIFLFFLAPLLPALVAATLHPLLDLADSRAPGRAFRDRGRADQALRP